MKYLVFVFVFLVTLSTNANEQNSFEEQVDMAPWSDKVAVFTGGRVKSFETFSRSFMTYILGTKNFEGQSPTFTYFDMLLRPERYFGKQIIFVKHKGLRAAIIGEVDVRDPVVKENMGSFMKSGLVSREVLQETKVQELLGRLRQDVRRFAASVETIEAAVNASDPRSLWGVLKVVPPTSGSFDEQWSTLENVAGSDIPDAWIKMRDAWKAEDAKTVNEELVKLSVLLPALGKGGTIYPSSTKLKLESFYFKMGNFTSIWLVYLGSTVLLLMAFVYRFNRVGKIGLALFALAVLLNTAAVLWRWYVSGRYPNTNMFESITTAAWMGSVFSLMMEYILRKNAMKYIFSIGASIAAMVALLTVRLYPLELNPQITNKMPVLHDVWLYIHVNFIIFSYCLIFVAAVSASIYLIRRFIQKCKNQDGKSDYARSGGVASLVEIRPGTKKVSTNNIGSVLDGATMILVELSFILLWTGIVMGAIWADHSWGRPWGWDPKEVFALNTFLIFVVLIHSRMKVKDKGFWTAWLALIGCAVMIFNWVIINFTISGLHSYA
ncbi:MAG: cytochrome c biogenesis protein CcsA [Phycisphaerae bacterium]|jgi:cytochrome c-type biogenesis protein CcsB|nr:cytochrome c biogenesis protein CcsA [Phycisphaerae bacterium]MBT6270478.1 cytochrome c biogenesis protein CcsA [Phycisphaerae bacterium]MBT6282974.1 cytochrome c biogenesis protein CcsA [Phycisphaerae bacterium]